MENSGSNTPVIEAASLSVKAAHSQRTVLFDLDWKVLTGEFWVIGGPHGAGKTDLLMTMAALRTPGGGSLRLFGKDLAGIDESTLVSLRKRIGFVFKGGGRMFSELTVAENVALPLCYHRDCSMEDAREEIASILELTDLVEVAQEKALALGAGRQQRIGLARALALKPDVLFLDEPAAGLEAAHRTWWADFLNRLSDQKMTLIAATNEPSLWHNPRSRLATLEGKRWSIVNQSAETASKRT